MKVRKKPVEVDAWLWDGRNLDLIKLLVEGNCLDRWEQPGNGDNSVIYIRTLEGVMSCPVGNYLIRGTAGEFYPCKPEIFKDIYENLDGTSIT